LTAARAAAVLLAAAVLVTAAVLVATGVACGGSPTPSPERAGRVEWELEAAYVGEDAEGVRAGLSVGLMRPGYRRALELSRLLQHGQCRREELAAVLAQNPTWIAFVEHGDCSAQVGREREALEDFVHAVDLAQTPEAVGYVLRRVCRAADESGLRVLAEMCLGHVD
jgi:hypothetical protein